MKKKRQYYIFCEEHIWKPNDLLKGYFGKYVFDSNYI